MALTTSRTRTQTALTKLVRLVANIHGELALMEGFAAESPEHDEVRIGRRQRLQADRDALYATIRQFDPVLDPTAIGASR